MNRIGILVTLFGALFVLGGGFLWHWSGADEAPTTTGGADGYTVTLPNSDIPYTPYAATQAQRSSPEERVVQDAYWSVASKENIDNIKLGKTVVVGRYALQTWEGDVMAGEALLEFDMTQGRWVIVSPGGGRWSVESLVAFGVPEAEARALLSALGR